NSLLIVRDHYGTDLLYDAADRAGILMVQCVPIHPSGEPERDVAVEISRLAGHPSLAGWYVGHLGNLSDRLAAAIRTLDPPHTIFRELPGEAACGIAARQMAAPSKRKIDNPPTPPLIMDRYVKEAGGRV